MNITITRVPYGKDNMPKELREYKLLDESNSPVGTIKEWIEYAKNNTFGKVIIK